jgi:hypothetical protein
MEEEKIETICTNELIDRAKFITRSSECDFNYLWRCKHPKQKDKVCNEICKYYKNPHE